MLQQLVVDVDDRSIHVVANDGDRDPEDFDRPDEGVMVPRLGTQAMLALAAYANQLGYTLMHVGLLDRSMTPLDPDEEERVEDVLVETLRTGDVQQARSLLSGVRGPLTAISLELVSALNEQVHLGWLGDVRSDSDAPIRDLLVPAWNTLHLA